MSKIRLNGTTSGYTEIAPPAVAGDNTVTLPSGNGSANQFLKNGSTAGTLGWSSMVETASGVGIGTTSPSGPLGVQVDTGKDVTVGFTSGSPMITYRNGSGAWFHVGKHPTSDALIFSNGATTTANEMARFTSGGYFKASNTGSYASSSATWHEFSNSANDSNLVSYASNASQTAAINRFGCIRSATSAYSFATFESGGLGGDFEFVLRGDGQAYADQSWNGGGADYAEYFEWEDGNPNAEDRRGYPVALVGNKIKIAEDGDTIIGIVSAAPVVLGDAAWNHWSGKYLKDEFGGYLLDENGSRQLNPDYDPTQPYVPREDRPEWSPIGLMGKLRLRKGQPVAANWLKLRDISATVEEWLVR